MKVPQRLIALQTPLLIILLVTTLCAAGFVGYSLGQGKLKKTPPAQANAPEGVLAEVGKSYNLPTDESPTIATITSEDKLKDQVFFANAKNGDQIILYSKAKLALLYRQSEKRLINVGPINYNDALQ